MTPGESGRARRSSAAISTPERPAAPVSAALPARPPAPGPSRQDTRRRGGASRHAARDEGTLAPADKRYPRPRWIRALRRAAKRAPLMLLLYPLAALLHLGLLVLQQGTAALHAPATYYEASFLTWGLRVAAAYPVLAVVPLLVVLDLAAMYAVARRDERREQEVLEARILDERLTQTTMAAVRLPTAGPARPTQPPRLERMPEEGGRPQLYGPPDDLGRLPEPPGFVGRARELAWLGERIGATLERGGGGVLAVTDATGAGGVGVSTLVGRALRQARAQGHFGGGVAVVSCEGQRDVTELLKTILARFDPLRRQPEQSDALSLAAAAGALLRGQETAIVLEDVGPRLALSDVTRPLVEAGAVVIATARSPLAGVRPDAQLALGVLALDEAVALFNAAFERGATTGMLAQPKTAQVERIVNAVARHPMAVALVASYAAEEHRVLSTLADDLQADERGQLGLPTDDVALALGLALDTAVGRLGEQPRALLATLGAFGAPDVGREAALAAAEGLELGRIGEALHKLERRGLVRETVDERVPAPGDAERLTLHPLVRARAAEELSKLTDEQRGAIQFAMTAYYSVYVGRVPDAALEADEANIYAALEWAHANAQTALEVAICERLRPYWRDRGRVTAALRYLPWGVAAAANRSRATGSREDRLREADMALSSGEMLRAAGRLEEAERVFKQNLALRQELGDQRGAGLALINLGELAQVREEVAAAEVYFRQGLTALQAAGAPREAAICLAWIGRLGLEQNRLETAEDAYREALILDDEVGDRQGAVQDLSMLGQIALRRGRTQEAERYLQRALGLRRELGDRPGEAIDLYQLGQVAQQAGLHDEAERYYSASLELRRAVRDVQGEGITLAQLGRVATHQGDLDRAEALYRQGLERLLEAQDAHNYAAVALRAGTFFVERRGKREEGATLLQQAIELYTQMGSPEEQRVRETAARLGVL